MDKKILVAIDGSVYSSNSLDYLIRLFNKDTNLSIHLISIVSSAGGDQNWMMDVDPLRTQSPATERRTRTAIKYLKDAKARLLRNGFTEKQVTFSTETTSSAIAIAIHHEANRGLYDGLLVGRRGVGKVGEMFFGSVSSHLIEHCHEIPLWLIDGEVTSTRFLLAVHSLAASLMAADHLSYIMQANKKAKVCLYHSSSLFKNKPNADPVDFHEQWGKQWCEDHLDIENFLFHAHAQILMDNGVEKKRISQLQMRMDIDVSHDLLRQAKKHHCGTIVIGRRGRNVNKGLLGGVSDRTMQYAQNMAVWQVG